MNKYGIKIVGIPQSDIDFIIKTHYTMREYPKRKVISYINGEEITTVKSDEQYKKELEEYIKEKIGGATCLA